MGAMMGLKVKCEYCKKNINAAATRCPHCQGAFSAEQMAERKKNMKQAGIGCVVLLVLLGLIGMCSGGANDEGEPTASASASSSSYGIAEPNRKVDPNALRNDTRTFITGIAQSMKPCERATKVVGEISIKIAQGTGNIYDGYEAAKDAVDWCETSYTTVDKVAVPVSFGAQQVDGAKATTNTCVEAVFQKRQAAALAMEVFDGDMSPSKLSEMKSKSQQAQEATLGCAAAVLALGGNNGVDAKEVAKLLDVQ